MTFDEALAFVDDKVKHNDLVVFMKGTPDFPMCGFSGRVTQILNHFKRPFEGINVLEDDNIRAAVKQYTNWPTVPQIFLKGEFLGGCDIATELASNGDLEKLLNEKLGKAV